MNMPPPQADDQIGTLLRALAGLHTHPDFAIGHLRGGTLLAQARRNDPGPWEEAADGSLLAALRDLGPGPAADAALTLATRPETGGEAWYAVALLRFLASRLADALEATSHALRLGFDEGVGSRLAGSLLYALGDLAGSEAAYRLTLASAPDNVDAMRNLARVLRAGGRLDESEALLRACLERRPDHPEVHTNLLMTFRARGDTGGERRHALALASDPVRSPAARTAALPSLVFLGEERHANAAAADLFAIAADDPAVVRMSAWTAWQTGDRDAALDRLTSLPEPDRSAEDWLLISLLLQETDPGEAIAAARIAASVGPGLEPDLTLRDLYEAAGDEPNARRHADAAATRALASAKAGVAPLRFLRAIGYAGFFRGEITAVLHDPAPAPPPADTIIGFLDGSARRDAHDELRKDRQLWEEGAFIAGAADFDVVVTDSGDGTGAVTAHIVGDTAYVNHRISQIPPARSAITQGLLRSPVTGLDMPDWLLRMTVPKGETIERAVFIGGHQNYGHFLWEVLSRVVVARSCAAVGSAPLCVLVHAPYQADMVRAVAQGHPVRLLATEPRAIRFRRSFAPRDLSYWASLQTVGGLVHSWAGDDEGGFPERVFLSRANHRPHRHRIDNEDAVRERLERMGFVTVYPDRLSVRDTVRLFRNARAIVGSSGAHFSNTPFCRPGTAVVELAAGYQALGRVWHWTLPYMFGYPRVLHRRVYGQDIHIEPGTALNWLTRFDPEAVEATVAEALAGAR